MDKFKLIGIILLIFSSFRCAEIEDNADLAKADKLMKEGNFQEAIKIYDNKILKNPKNPHYYDTRGTFYMQLGDYRRAIESLNSAISLDSTDAITFEKRALCHIQLGNFDEAIIDSKYSIKLAGNTALGRVVIADLYFESGNTEKAIKECLSALIDFPNNHDILNFLGYVKLETKEYRIAIDYLNEAIEAKPDEPYPYNNRGFAKLKLGLFEEAKNDIEKSLNLDASNSLAYKNLGLIYLSSGDKSQACNNFRQAIKYRFTTNYGTEVKDSMAIHCR